MIIYVLLMLFNLLKNLNKLIIKYQSCPKSRKIITFKQKICVFCISIVPSIDIKTIMMVDDDTGGRLALWYHVYGSLRTAKIIQTNNLIITREANWRYGIMSTFPYEQ